MPDEIIDYFWKHCLHIDHEAGSWGNWYKIECGFRPNGFVQIFVVRLAESVHPQNDVGSRIGFELQLSSRS